MSRFSGSVRIAYFRIYAYQAEVLLILQRGGIHLSPQSPGTIRAWKLPGGRVYPGDGLAHRAREKFREKAGFWIPRRDLQPDRHVDAGHSSFPERVFFALARDAVPARRFSSERTERIGWFPIHELPIHEGTQGSWGAKLLDPHEPPIYALVHQNRHLFHEIGCSNLVLPERKLLVPA